MVFPLWVVTSGKRSVAIAREQCLNIQSITHRQCNDVDWIRGCSNRRGFGRCLSSSISSKKGTTDVKSYLEAWVGEPSSSLSSSSLNNYNPVHRQPQPTATNNTHSSSLALSGGSYLIPTLRLHRSNDTIEALVARLEEENGIPNGSNSIDANPNNNNGRIDFTGTTKKQGKERSCWRCPVVVDMSAFSPDGSPHYVPPKRGFLKDIVRVLDRYGIAVLGLTTSTTLPRALEEEAGEHLGLPTLLSSRRQTSAAAATTHSKYPIQDIINLVKQRGTTKEEEQDNADIADGNNSILQGKLAEEDSSPRVRESHNSSTTNRKQILHLENEGRGEHAKTFVYHGAVRSGQQVSSPKGHSLVVMGSVNSGGEVLSDGNIFVFGKLRGRALAGLSMSSGSSDDDDEKSGNNATIIATGFDAELVCIGDTFTTIDQRDLKNKFGIASGQPVMVTLENKTTSKQLVFQKVCL